MTRPALDDTTRRALADLDPAPRVDLRADQRATADRALAGILSHEVWSAGPSATGLRRRQDRRWVAVLAATAVVAVLVTLAALVGLARNGGGDPDVLQVPAAVPSPAVPAGWTSSAEPVPPAQAAELGAACRDDLARSQDEMKDPPGSGARKAARMLQRSEPVLADRRGSRTYLLLATDDGFTATCVFEDPSVSAPDQDQGSAQVGLAMGYGAVPTLPAADGILVLDVGANRTMDRGEAWTTGLVGEDVAGVVVTDPDGTTVVATVVDGWFFAWWPFTGGTFSPASTFTLTLRDGTVLPPLPSEEVSRQSQATTG